MASPCFDKACELLARRSHFRAEIERKLRQRGFDETAVSSALNRLSELGYLDDAACAHSLALGPLSRRGYGPLRMRAELERRGAPAKEAAAAVETVFVDGEEEAARRVAERWLSRRTADRAALARHLGRKGFSSGTVLRLARELASENDD
jgi:regulatory protein